MPHDTDTDRTVTAVVTGHPNNASAVRWAVGEARLRRCAVRILSVLSPVSGDSPGPSSTDGDAATTARLLVARSIAADAVHGGEGDVPVGVRSERGPLVPTLVEESRRTALMVVGSLGVDPRHPGHIGGARAGLVAAAGCPVVHAVKTGARDVGRSAPVVAVVSQGSDLDILAAAAEEALLRAAPLHIVASGSCDRMVDDFVDGHVARGTALVAHRTHHPVEMVARYAVSVARSAQLVVMRAHDAESGARAWHRSERIGGESFLHALDCPAMLVPGHRGLPGALAGRLREALRV